MIDTPEQIERNERARRERDVRRVSRIVEGAKMWRAGKNTAEIASALGEREADVYRDIEAIRGPPLQFERSA